MKLPVFKLENYLAKYANTPYILSSSECEPFSLKEILAFADDETVALWDNLKLGSKELGGGALLRKEASKLYKNVSSKEIALFTGGEEGIFIAMNVLLRAGDHVIVITPCYPPLKILAQEIGTDVSEVSLKESSGGWSFDIERLKSQMRPTTRLIIINFPHHPTGVQIDQGTLESIIECAKQTGAYLFSDEVFRLLEHKEGTTLPSAVDLYDKAISLGSLSKAFGLSGLRIGWMATKDEEVLRRCLDFKCYLSLSNSAPSEMLALMALRAKEKILERNLKIVRMNVELLDRFFQKFPRLCAWKKPSAGTSAFPKMLVSSSPSEFTDDLAMKEGVLLTPASIYGVLGNYFQISFGRKEMPDALERFERYLKRYSDKLDY